MFNKALIVASIFAANSQADFTPAKSSFESLADSTNCLADYLQECHSAGDCCAPMLCLAGGNPWHCQTICFADSDCDQYKELYGPMYCTDLGIYGGQCRQR